ncbi:MAG TPA: TonB-dependent receptor, partial [Bryobacteraceae bacterium]|nr:TonB-dependent receptor [Bryobacteraceae bacterium]
FERAQTALPTNTAGSGNSFASFLLGLPNDVQFSTLPYPDPWIKYGYHAGFFQDDWRVTPKLTLNLGIRYEVPIGFHMANYQFSMVDLNLPNAAAGGLPGAMIYAGNGVGRTGTKRFYPTDFSNLGPRAGFAYQLTSKTVLRGGYGIFYQTLGNGGCGCQLGFGGIPGQILGNGVEAALQWDTGFRIPQGAKPPFIDPTAFNFQNVDHLGDNFGKAPRVQNWSFNIQHEVKKFLIDIGYVGNRATRLASTLYINQVDPKYLSLGSLLRLPISDPQVAAAGFKKPFAAFPDNQPLAQALRPYPQYFNIADRNAGVGRTWYDSLQVMVIRRFGFWQTQTSYVRSKSQTFLHYRQIFSQTQTSPQNNYDLSDSKTYLPFDQPNFFNSLNTFDLPFGRGKKYLSSSGRGLDAVVGGWTIGFIAQYRSGTLIDVAPPNTLNNGTLFTQFKKANATGVPVRTGVDRRDIDPANPQARYFGCNAVPLPGNPNAYTCAAGSTPFVAPGEFEFGNVSQFIGNFRQPPIFTENMSILKRFTLFPMRNDGGLKFTYSANIFNLFNRTNFGVNGAIGNADFGRASNPQNNPRLVTMGLRLEF